MCVVVLFYFLSELQVGMDSIEVVEYWVDVGVLWVLNKGDVIDVSEIVH
jgi:hypothetical protein